MSNYSTLLTENDCKLLKILKSRKKEIENIFFKYSEHYILGIRVDANGGCSRQYNHRIDAILTIQKTNAHKFYPKVLSLQIENLLNESILHDFQLINPYPTTMQTPYEMQHNRDDFLLSSKNEVCNLACLVQIIVSLLSAIIDD